jgi:hypothetical protein
LSRWQGVSRYSRRNHSPRRFSFFWNGGPQVRTLSGSRSRTLLPLPAHDHGPGREHIRFCASIHGAQQRGIRVEGVGHGRIDRPVGRALDCERAFSGRGKNRAADKAATATGQTQRDRRGTMLVTTVIPFALGLIRAVSRTVQPDGQQMWTPTGFLQCSVSEVLWPGGQVCVANHGNLCARSPRLRFFPAAPSARSNRLVPRGAGCRLNLL